MSYPSVKQVLEVSGITAETADPEQLRIALWQTFTVDLPQAVNHLIGLAKKVKESGKRVLDIQDPNSTLGKQLIRLLSADIARKICEEELGIALGLYNCCGIVAATEQSELNMTVLEQINLQNGVLASADC